MKEYIISPVIGAAKNFEVSTLNGETVYTAIRRFSFCSSKISLKNSSGESVAEIKRLKSLVVPSYRITVKDGVSFVVKRNFGFSVSYKIKGIPAEVVSDADCEKYLIIDKDGKKLTEIQKIRDKSKLCYRLKTLSDFDSLYGICITIAVDRAMKALSRAK